MFPIQRVHPRSLLWAAQFRLCSLGKGKEELSVCAPGGFPFPILLYGQLLQRVFAHSLKHREAALSTVVATYLLSQQALIEERLHHAQYIYIQVVLSVAHRLGSLKSTPP